MLKREWQALWKNKFMIIVLIAIITIPTIYTSIFLGSMWDPYGEIDHLPVAVVNNDKAAEYDGKTMEVGKELVDNLKENNSLDFNFVDAEQAAAGLKNGTYYMVITIPEDFSYNATTLMDEHPKTMELQYDTNPGTNYIASKMSETAINKIRTTVAEKVTKQYAETIFDQLGTIADGFNDAVDATQKMSDGTDKLVDGNTKIGDNLKTLADSSLTFKDGADTLQVGLKTYTDGVSTVNDGASQLKDGIDTLAEGTGTLADGASALADGSSKLKDGASDLADGTSDLKKGTSDLKKGSSTLASGVSDYTDAAGQIYAGSKTLVANNESLNKGVATLSTGVATLKDGSSSLLSGLETMSSQLKQGLSKQQLAQLTALTAGLEQAGTQMKQADQALQSLNTDELSSQVSTLSKGVSSLVDSSKKTSALVGAVGSDIDAAADSIKNSAGFSKLSADEQQEILDAVTGIKTSANYQGAKGYAQGVSSGAEQLKEGLANTDLSAVSQVSALKDGIHTIVTNDLFGNSKKAISTQLTSLQTIQTALDRTGESSDQMGLIQGMKAVDAGLSEVQTGIDGKDGLKAGVKAYTDGASTVNSALAQLDSNSSTLASGATQVRDGASKLNTGAKQLNTGAGQLSSGATQLDAGVSTLTSKVPTLTAGVDKLQSGSTQLAAGTAKLVANNSALLSGIGQLSDGATKISDGSNKLAEASGTLGEGLETLQDGTKELHDALKDGSDEVNESVQVADDDTYEMLSAPVKTSNTEMTSVDNNGNAMAAYMMSVGLWVGCLAFSIMYSLDKPAGKVKNGFSWWLSKASVGGIIAGVQAVVMVFALKGILGFNPASLGKTVLIAVFASYAFMSLFYLFNLLLGKVGSFLLLIFMVLQLGGSAGTYPIELSSGFYQAINPYMPFTYSVNAFRSTIASGQSLTSAIAVFSSIFVVCTALTIVVFHFKAKKAQKNEIAAKAEVVLE